VPTRHGILQKLLEAIAALDHSIRWRPAPALRIRAMIGEQTFDGRRENLNQANKLLEQALLV
jgi:hypothetical protein